MHYSNIRLLQKLRLSQTLIRFHSSSAFCIPQVSLCQEKDKLPANGQINFKEKVSHLEELFYCQITTATIIVHALSIKQPEFHTYFFFVNTAENDLKITPYFLQIQYLCIKLRAVTFYLTVYNGLLSAHSGASIFDRTTPIVLRVWGSLTTREEVASCPCRWPFSPDVHGTITSMS